MSIGKPSTDLTAAVTALNAAINAKSGAVVGAGTATVPRSSATRAPAMPPVAQAPVFQGPAAPLRCPRLPASPTSTAPATALRVSRPGMLKIRNKVRGCHLSALAGRSVLWA